MRPHAKILIVDDDEDLRQLMSEVLELEGYEVVTAANGKEALARLSHFEPDVILLDLRMPVMSGPEMYRALRAHPEWRYIPVVVVSAAMLPELSELDVEGIIRKPFDVDELKARILALRLSDRAAGSERGPSGPN